MAGMVFSPHGIGQGLWTPRKALPTCSCNRQQPQSVVNGFVEQSEFEAMKTLSGWEAAHCDEHPFRAKIKVSAWTIFELLLFEQKS